MRDSRLTLVMMAGLPGAGKTTLAYALKSEFGWQVIDKDEYRIDLLKNGIDDDRASKTAYERAFAEIRTLLITHQVSVIFDTAALHRFILDTIKEILDSAPDVQLKVILCVVDRDVREERLQKRTFQHTRITVDPDTITDYLQYFDHLPPDTLILVTNSPMDEYIEQAKNYLRN